MVKASYVLNQTDRNAPLRQGFFTDADALYASKSRGFGGEIGVNIDP